MSTAGSPAECHAEGRPMNRSELSGVLTALPTPFTRDGSELNLAALRDLVAIQLASGIGGVVTAGSLGEFTALTQEERFKVLDAVLAEVRGKVPVVAGVSAYTTAETVAYARAAQAAGADAVMVLPLGYWPLDDDEVLRLFSAVSEATDLPIMLYNNPIKTAGVDIRADVMGRIVRETNVRYVKETSGDVRRIQEILLECGDQVGVMTGDDMAPLPALSLGASGWVSGVSNVLPRECAALLEEWHDGNAGAARELHYRLIGFRYAIERLGSPVAVIKAALECQGVTVGPPRPPLGQLSDQHQKQLAEMLAVTARADSQAGEPQGPQQVAMTGV